MAEGNSSSEESMTEGNSLAKESCFNSEIYRRLLFIRDHGLEFERTTVSTKICVVEIVAVGSCDCCKVELIKSVFGDHPSFTFKNLDGRDEYRIYLSKNMFVHIWISDVKDVEFVKKANFRYKTVVFFCYDAEDLKTLASLRETWIPLIFKKHTKEMSYFLVGIELGEETGPKPTNGVYSQNQKVAIEDKARELCFQLHDVRHIGCSIEEKKFNVERISICH